MGLSKNAILFIKISPVFHQALKDTLDGKDENTPIPATLSVVSLWFVK